MRNRRTCCLGISVIAIALTACGSRSAPEAARTDTATVVQQNKVETPKPVVHTSVTVSIEQMKFQPEEITVSNGDTVIFVNHDMVQHDVTEEKQQWKSNPIAANDSWRVVPTQSGNYFCSIHPVMKGKIVVQ